MTSPANPLNADKSAFPAEPSAGQLTIRREMTMDMEPSSLQIVSKQRASISEAEDEEEDEEEEEKMEEDSESTRFDWKQRLEAENLSTPFLVAEVEEGSTHR